MAKTKDEFVTLYVKMIRQSKSEVDKFNTTRIIIREINSLKYEDGHLISNKDKQYIIKKIREEIAASKILKEAQESDMFFRSLNAIMPPLKPVVDELDTELLRLQEESEDNDED